MELLVKIYDELDDLVGPLFAMASAADWLRGTCLAAAIAAGVLLDSLLVTVAGFALSGLLMAVPLPTSSLRAGLPRLLQPARDLR